MKNCNRVWITWETQRRSYELAKILNCKFYLFEYEGVLRYLRSIVNTLRVFANKSTNIIFVQNPSMVLATLACIYRIITKKKVIVDRHTTFRLDKKNDYGLGYLIFSLLNNFTIKKADLTIVTNNHLASIVEQMKGKAYILPDKLPDLLQTEHVGLKKGFNLLLITSYGEDEPIQEALIAAEKMMNHELRLYISGNCNKLKDTIKQKASSNVFFTGYLKENDYINLVFAVDAIMVLTTANSCMLCGCYEAVAARKPLITSDKKVLQEYFKGSVFVDNTSEGIVSGIKDLMINYNKYANNAVHLKDNINKEWQHSFNELEEVIKAI